MKKIVFFLFVLFSMQLYGQPTQQPEANPAAIVKSGNVRFTVLTPGIIRMEWDSTGAFTDKASFVVINRNLSVPKFKKSESGSSITITTDKLVLKYKKGTGRFTDKNLEIAFFDKKNKTVWHPGLKNTGNLKGTYRTLDGCRGKYFEGTKNEIPIEDGLLSTNGWTFIDDSNNFLFDQSDWNWVQSRENKNVQDFYFMAYGKDYKSLLSDFTKIAGKVPIPPRYAFGYWWSRYWNYSDNELRDLVRNFEKYQLPLDVLVIDMDWHKTKGLNRADEFGQTAGWTGYTWEKSLFPNPDKFLKWVKQKDLKVTLNLHPASGIPADEMQYADFAKAMDFDTIGHKSIPFEVADKRYMKNLFNLVLHPIEKQGIDFWWLDWQQWPTSKKLEGLSNTWWLNYCFFTDQERQGKQRPLLYHRWGGLGNHRYQIGFSGDAIIDWETLDYQPYFTTTASNVLYGYWSHDLGGHFFGNIPDDQKKMDPELYTRWMQFGALSPIFRTHSTKDPHIVKDIWNFPHEYSSIITEVVNERYALVPYIYTMARKTYDTGISLCRPMYYDYPEKQEAYSFKNEYMFGDNLLVQPITAPSRNDFSDVKVWLPAGNDWYEWHTGTMLKGGQVVERKFLISEFPIYVKAGSIIPMYPKLKNLEEKVNDLIVSVFPGGNSETKLYEDAGNNIGYEKEEYSFTTIKSEKEKDGSLKVTVMPREGSFPEMLSERNYEIRLHGSVMPQSVSINGNEISYSAEQKGNAWNYSGSDLTAHIYIPQMACNQKLEVVVKYPQEQVNIDGMIGKMNRLKLSTAYLKDHWYQGAALPEIIPTAEEVNMAIEYNPENFSSLVKMFNESYPLIPDVIGKTHVGKVVIDKCVNYIK